MNDEPDDGDFLRSSAQVQAVRIIHDWSDDESIVGTIAAAIEERWGGESIEPLHEYVDTDALEALFRPISEEKRRDRGQVSFSVEGFDVTVDANGLIVIEER